MHGPPTCAISSAASSSHRRRSRSRSISALTRPPPLPPAARPAVSTTPCSRPCEHTRVNMRGEAAHLSTHVHKLAHAGHPRLNAGHPRLDERGHVHVWLPRRIGCKHTHTHSHLHQKINLVLLIVPLLPFPPCQPVIQFSLSLQRCLALREPVSGGLQPATVRSEVKRQRDMREQARFGMGET
jgi:hypothetical protein